MIKRLALSLLIFACVIPLSAQESSSTKYWIFFTDKGDISQLDPSDYLSKKALDRRELRNIPLDSRDLPVHSTYIKTIVDKGIPKVRHSKWLNAMTAWMNDTQLTEVLSLPFVKSVEACLVYEVDYGWEDYRSPSKRPEPTATLEQLSMTGLDVLHAQEGGRFNGRGMTIAIMDNGFRDVDTISAFSHLWDDGRILDWYDFVENDKSVFDFSGKPGGWGNHGVAVFSILGGYLHGSFEGAAPGASFMLFRTEDDSQESHVEEDNWVAAAEYADSAGADIFSTSLGYSDGFTDGGGYNTSQMDGETPVITRAADLAASRGILVINSAGNSGSSAWRIITAPADGDSVLAVGAAWIDYPWDSILSDFVPVNKLSGFSSQGPTADGRIKPDLVSFGQGNAYINEEGKLRHGSGTSFSCPMMSGLAACIWQSKPEMTNMELFDYLKQSADRYLTPDTLWGYGVPNAMTAINLIHGEENPGILLDDTLLNENELFFTYDPIEGSYMLWIENFEQGTYNAKFQISDVSGREVMAFDFVVNHFTTDINFVPIPGYYRLSPGIYVFRLVNMDDKESLLTQKFLVIE